MAKAATAQKSTKNQKIVNETSNFLLIDSKNDVSFHNLVEWFEMAEESCGEPNIVFAKRHSNKITAHFISDTPVLLYLTEEDEIKVKRNSSISVNKKNFGNITVNGADVYLSSKDLDTLIDFITGFMFFNHRGPFVEDFQLLNDRELLLVFNH